MADPCALNGLDVALWLLFLWLVPRFLAWARQ